MYTERERDVCIHIYIHIYTHTIINDNYVYCKYNYS